MSLSLKQERFVTAYLGPANGNATQAARLAGYSDPEVSAFNCKQNQAIRARIDERLAAEALSAGEVLRALTTIATAPIERFMQISRPANDETGQPMTVRLDYSSKVRALELLGKYFGLWTDKAEHFGTVTVVREYSDADRDGLTKKLDELAERRRLGIGLTEPLPRPGLNGY